MSISFGYMLDPVKSNAALYVFTDDTEVFMYQYNCRNIVIVMTAGGRNGGFDKALSGMEYVLVGAFDYGNCSLLVQKAPKLKFS